MIPGGDGCRIFNGSSAGLPEKSRPAPTNELAGIFVWSFTIGLTGAVTVSNPFWLLWRLTVGLDLALREAWPEGMAASEPCTLAISCRILHGSARSVSWSAAAARRWKADFTAVSYS